METITEVNWRKKGEKLFGKNALKWKFVCPVCGNIQMPEDFKKYKDKGAKLSDAYFNCIGRFSEGKGTLLNKKESPCDYTSGGLLNMSPVSVVDKQGKKHFVFDFLI
jgi:hypothetical protein